MKIQKIKQFINKNWFTVSVVVIMTLAFILRFYDYQNRFGLAYDQAHDAVIARYAIEKKLIPLVGPFSSAGPFQTGGEWYWFIMLGSLLIPTLLASPWIFLTLTYVLFVFLIIKIGKKIIDTTYGLIVGLFAAVSTAQIAQSTNLTNQGPEAIVALAAVWAAVSYIKKKTPLYLFLLGFFVSLGISIHLQAVALGTLILLTILFTLHHEKGAGLRGIPSWRSVVALLAGLFIPLIPILIFDVQNDFINSRNMLQYFLHDQYKIPLEALGRRWLTYAGVLWPAAWGHIIGGSTILGYIISAGTLVAVFLLLAKRKISKNILFLATSFFVMVVILRYIRTPLYDSYLTFLHPFVLLLSGWVVYLIYRKSKILGLLVLLIILGGSLYKDYFEITYRGDITRKIVKIWQRQLYKSYPGQKFSVYDYRYKYVDKSVPFVLYLYQEGKVSNNGVKIGLVIQTAKENFSNKVVAGSKDGYEFIALGSSSSASLEKLNWVNVNPSYIYNSTENWRKLSGK